MNRSIRGIVFLYLISCISLSAQQAVEFCHHDEYLKEQQLDPEWAKMREKVRDLYRIELERIAKTGTQRTQLPVLTIPVVFHVIHDCEPLGSSANPDMAAFIAGLATLNDDFSHTSGMTFSNPNSGVDTDIEFCLASTDPNGNYTSGVVRHANPEAARQDYGGIDFQIALQTYKWPEDKYFNIFLTAQAAGTWAGRGGSARGIIVKSLEGILTHETGHYLGLVHTFSGGCTNNDCLTDGDGICDTPPASESLPGGVSCVQTNSCNTDAADPSNNNPYRFGDTDDLVENYMHWNGNCWEAFTQGQSTFMRTYLQTNYQSVLDHASIACASQTKPANNAGIIEIIPNKDACLRDFTPQAVLKNHGTTNLVSATITVEFDGQVASINNWTGNLAPDATEIVNLPAIQFTGNGRKIIAVRTSVPNGQVDGLPDDDSQCLYIEHGTLTNLPIELDAEDPEIQYTSGTFLEWSDYSFCGSDRGFFLRGLTDEIASFKIPTISLEGYSSATLSFNYAHIPADPSLFPAHLTYNDSIIITVETADGNCITTETILWRAGRLGLATNNPPAYGDFSSFPTCDQVLSKSLDLAPFLGNPNVTITVLAKGIYATAFIMTDIDISGQHPCAITGISSGVQTTCDENSNLYDQELIITYATPPLYGDLIVNGNTFPITGSPQSITLTGLLSDGNGVDVTASFSEIPGCSISASNVFTAPSGCCDDYFSAPDTYMGVSGTEDSLVFTDVISIATNGMVTDVNINNLSVDYGTIGELKATLTSPAGTTITLFDRPGYPFFLQCEANNILVSLDDEAVRTAIDLEYTCDNASAIGLEGRFQSLGALSAFDGEDQAGNWTLKIIDLDPFYSIGRFNSWELEICSTTPTCSISSVTPTQPSSCVSNTGSIAVTATGDGSLEYSIDNGVNWQVSNTFSNLVAGEYYVKIREQNPPSCMSSYSGNPVVINAPPQAPTISTVQVDHPMTCSSSTGMITINASGTGSLEYSADNGANWQTSNEFSELAPGPYNIQVRLASIPSCVTSYESNPVSISSPPSPPSIDQVNDVQPMSCDLTTGSISIQATGNGTLEYSVNNGSNWQTSNSFTGLTQGTYNVLVRLQATPSCLATHGSNPIQINAPPSAPLISSVMDNQPSDCANPTGSIVINASGSSTLEYSIDNGDTWQLSNTFEGLSQGSFNVKVRLQSTPSCMTTHASNPIQIEAPPSPPSITSAVPVNPTDCANPTGSITINATGSGSLEYSIDNGINWQTSHIFTGLVADSYNIKVRLEGIASCMIDYASNPVTIQPAPTPPSINTVSRTQPVSCGQPTGSITIDASGSGTLEYSKDNGANWQLSNAFTGLESGNYNIKVRIQGIPSCATTFVGNPVTINNPPESPTITSVQLIHPETCLESTGTITVNASGSSALEYSIDNGSTWETSNVFTNVTPGTYHVIVRLISTPTCVTAYGDNPVSIDPPPSVPSIEEVNVTQPTSCDLNTGSITIIGSGEGPLQYSIDNGNSWQTSNAFTGLTPGTYNVQIRLDGIATCGASYGSNPIQINAPPSPPSITSVVPVNPTDCANPTGSITISASGSSTLEYSIDNGASWQTSNLFSGLSAGDYNVKVRLESIPSCMVSYGNNPVNIQSPPTAPTIHSVMPMQPASCAQNTGSVTIEASGDGVLEYSINDGMNWQESNTFSGLGPGDYNIRVRSQATSSCVTSYNQNPVTINPPPTSPFITVTHVLQPTCAVPLGSILVSTAYSGSGGPLEFSVDNGNTWSFDNSIFSNLDPGEYNILARKSGDITCIGVNASNPVIIDPPPSVPVVADVQSIQPTCELATGTITVSPNSNNYQYSVDNGATWTDNHIFSGIPPGSYQVGIRRKDDVSCSSSFPGNPVILSTPTGCETTCSITSISVGMQTPCTSIGNTYSQELTIHFTNPPSSGFLLVNGRSFAVTSSTKETIVLEGLPADGGPVSVTALFSEAPLCRIIEIDLFMAPENCSPEIACATIVATDVPKMIPDPGTVTSTVEVTSLTNFLPVLDVNIKDLNILHEWIGDLSVTLTSPSGTTVTLFDRPGAPTSAFGCDGDNALISLDDAFDQSATMLENTCNNAPAITGNFRPLEALSNFSGENAIGIWTLSVSDAAAEFTGSLQSWTFEICIGRASNCSEQAILSLDNTIDPSTYHGNVIQSSGNIANSSAPVYFESSSGALLKEGFFVGTQTTFQVNTNKCVCKKSQWASKASASTFRDDGFSQEGHPQQATGEPDAAACVDDGRAWSPASESADPEFLRLEYATAVQASELHIHESFQGVTSPQGFVIKIDFVDTNDVTHTIWQGSDMTTCGNIFSPSFAPTDYFVKSVIIHTQTPSNNFEQIDAVQLIGTICPANN